MLFMALIGMPLDSLLKMFGIHYWLEPKYYPGMKPMERHLSRCMKCGWITLGLLGLVALCLLLI